MSTQTQIPPREALDIWIEEAEDGLAEDIVTYKSETLHKIHHRVCNGDWNCTEMLAGLAFEEIEIESKPYIVVASHPFTGVDNWKKTLVRHTVTDFIYAFWRNRDAEGLLRFLLSLPAGVRRAVVEREGFDTFLKLLPEEVLDVLKKSRVEVKVVLDVEEAVELALKYGSRWRDVVKDMIREAVSRIKS